MVLSNSQETLEVLEVAILAVLGLFVAINTTYLVVSIILNCKEANRKKILSKRIDAAKEYQEANIGEINRKF